MFMMEKPLPAPTEDTEPIWDAFHEDRFVLPRCGACGHWYMPPGAVCPECLSPDVGPAEASGRATVWSWIVVHKPQHPGFLEDAPYNVAIVETAEGVRMHTRLIGLDAAAIAIGMEVEVVFEHTSDQIHLPLFKPVGAEIDPATLGHPTPEGTATKEA